MSSNSNPFIPHPLMASILHPSTSYSVPLSMMTSTHPSTPYSAAHPTMASPSTSTTPSMHHSISATPSLMVPTNYFYVPPMLRPRVLSLSKFAPPSLMSLTSLCSSVAPPMRTPISGPSISLPVMTPIPRSSTSMPLPLMTPISRSFVSAPLRIPTSLPLTTVSSPITPLFPTQLQAASTASPSNPVSSFSLPPVLHNPPLVSKSEKASEFVDTPVDASSNRGIAQDDTSKLAGNTQSLQVKSTTSMTVKEISTASRKSSSSNNLGSELTHSNDCKGLPITISATIIEGKVQVTRETNSTTAAFPQISHAQDLKNEVIPIASGNKGAIDRGGVLCFSNRGGGACSDRSKGACSSNKCRGSCSSDGGEGAYSNDRGKGSQ